ncbi:MAG: hypothetical protein UW51_C0006G0199 [Candidatus Amesbacteria bacterium GW2011_GWA1_44_24]|nr:MAG: hypothetical protein UW51_C0006G0199 [Candidatus Amesbacteria bacterium GW2011_GWA1_44_24]
MEYWVYENWTHKYARTHKTTCGYCNQGRGFHKDTSDVNGRWLGPFKDKQEAELAAKKTKRKVISHCSRCM